jgi:hypothetical protein
VRKALVMMTMATATLGVAACSGNDNGPAKRVSADGKTQAIATDGAQHVAYLLNATAGFGAPGELHLASADGKDFKIASSIYVGGFLLSPRGKGMLFTQANSGNDASLSWVDLSSPATPPKTIFTGGLQQQPINPGTSSPTFTTPLLQQGFLSPSGRFYIMGVLAPNVGGSPDLHVIDLDSGTDVFVRDNGGFDYLELVLPDDTMVFQDAVGGNGGIAGGAGLQTLFWISLTSATPTAVPATIDVRTGGYSPTGDNKTIVYQRADTRELYSWDAVGKPATGTKVASNALNFAAGASGPIAYIGTDHSVHVVGLDGTVVVDVAGTTALADPFSTIFISEDGADVYYFQAVDTQDSRGTLMHLAATAGATPAKVADSASPYDVHPVPGALLFLQNVDGTGTMGDAIKSARDGSGAMALGTGVPINFLTVTTPAAGGSKWLSAHLTAATEDKDKQLADGIRAIVGALELTSESGTTAIDPAARISQFQLSDDLDSLVYVGGTAFDVTFDNYVGGLSFVPTATPTMKPAAPILAGVTEVGSVVKRSLFVNAPKASTPGVYFVTF